MDGAVTTHVTGYPHFLESKSPVPLELTWESLVASLSNVREQPCTAPGTGATACIGENCPHKKGSAWSPVRLKADGQRRLNVNVEAVTVAVFDLDDVTNTELIAVSERLKSLGLEFVMHSTHRHLQAGPGHNFIRLVLPFSREARPDEWPSVWAGALEHLQLPFTPGVRATTAVPSVKARGVDRQCKDPARLLFAPTRPRGMEALVQRGRGEPLDVDVVKALAPPPPPYVPPTQDMFAMLSAHKADDEDDGEDEPVEGEPEEVSELKRLRRLLVERKRYLAGSTTPEEHEKYRLVCAVLDKTALGFAGDAVSGRSTSVNRIASIVVNLFPEGTSWEAAAEILRPSVAAMEMDPSDPNDNLDHWLKVAKESYERGAPRAAQFRQQREIAKRSDEAVRTSLLEIAVERSGGRMRLAEAAPKPITQEAEDDNFAAPAGVKPQEDPNAWKTLLQITADKKLKPVPHNIYVWLKHSPQTHGAIRYNRLTNEIETQGGHFAGVDQEVLDTAIVDYMQVHFGVSFNKTDVRDRILRVAYENSYDPLQDYLNALVWDGVPRLDNFFLGEEHVAKNKAGEDVTVPAYVMARRTNRAGEDITDYLKLIAPKVFISGAARALWPGPECQVDTMLVLEGTSEGEGKTRLIRTLAGPWYIETHLALDNKDSQMIPAGNFLVELGELSSVRKSEGNALKSFLSVIIDKFRLPYGKTIKPFFRRCIFIGTTNDEEWLTYDKGERRWWPVYVLAINHPAVLRDRDQLWAEAVVRLKAKERWHLEGKDENALARSQARQRIEPTMLENLLEHWWRGMSDSTRARLTFISKVDLYKDALKLGEEALLRMPSGTEAKVAKAMKRMGFERGAAGTLQGWVPAGQPVTVVEEKPKGSVSYMKLVHGEAAGGTGK